MALVPDYLDSLPDNMVRLYLELEDGILKDMARRISTYEYFIPAAQHQYKQAKEMGLMHDEILKRLSEHTGKSDEELERLMLEAGTKSLEADDKIHRAAGKALRPLNASPALKTTLNAGLANTKMLFNNLSRTTAKEGAKQLTDTLDIIHMQVVSGAFDADTAIRNGIKEIAKTGLKAVKYPSGRIETLEAAVRRATVTGVNQTAGKLQLIRADEAGCELVEVTAHEGARPEHALWQGRVYSLKGSGDKYPNLAEATGYGTGAGLCGWNCRHNFFPFYEGVSAETYDKKMIDEYNKAQYEYNGKKLTEYEARKQQRYLERGIRRWKREFILAENAGIDTAESVAKLRRWRQAEKDFLTKTGLKEEMDRVGVFSAKRFKNAQEYGKIGIAIDKFVPCLEDIKTGEILATDVARITRKQELKGLTKGTGWFINWQKELESGNEVYGLYLKGDDILQGLVSMKSNPMNQSVYGNWIVAAPHNRGVNKRYNGVGGHLYAIMGKKSIDYGYGGFVEGMAANAKLLEHYMETVGATPMGGTYKFFVDEKSIGELLNKYNFEWRK